MKFVYIGARILIGGIFLVFGLNGFFNFLPLPQPPPGAGEFVGAIIKTGYLYPFMKITEIVCAIFFLTNRFAALAAVLIAPITINIALFHFFLDPLGTPIATALLVANFLVAWENWGKYGQLLRPN